MAREVQPIQKPRTRGEMRKTAKLLTRAVVAAAAAERKDRAELYRHIVRHKSLAERRHFVIAPDNVRVLGPEWAEREGFKLDTMETAIRESVPSGAWFDAIWRRGETFPPQEAFNRPHVEAVLRAWLKERLMTARLFQRCLVLLAAGVDPLQVIQRRASRMRPAQASVRYGAKPYVDERPTAGNYTRRPTPPQAIGRNDGSDDKYDLMPPGRALFCNDPPSVTALQFQMIGMMKGRDQRQSEQTAKRRERAEREAARKAREKAGIIEDETEPETIDDEFIDVDCTDVTGAT